MYYLIVVKPDPHVVCSECLDIISEEDSVEVEGGVYLCFDCFEELSTYDLGSTV